MPTSQPQVIVSTTVERIEGKVVTARGQRVLLDVDLAELYQVAVKRLNQAVKRNSERFPPDFMFQLTRAEWSALTSQSVTSKKGRGGRRYAPYAFTEYGAIMVATLLDSARAISVSILVVRAFVRLRGALMAHADLAAKLAALEHKYDRQFRVVFEAIREILEMRVEESQRRIGFS